MKQMKLVLYSLFAIFYVCSAFSSGQVMNKSSSGIYMSVSGRVINLETGTGVPGVEILISGSYHFAVLTDITDEHGNFCIRKVPEGIYEISDTFIHKSCPEELIIAADSFKREFKVENGKNIHGLDIYLRKGATISGRVFYEDGITPVKGAKVERVPRLMGKKDYVTTDDQGKYEIVGVNKGRRKILIDIKGYIMESKPVIIEFNETINNVDFILGKGIVSVKGTILSSVNDQGIANAKIHILSLLRGPDFSGGFDITDTNGNYSIKGFLKPGKFKVSVFHDEYKTLRKEIDLKNGENNINFTVEPDLKKKKDKLSKKKTRESIAGEITPNIKDCECFERSDKLNNGQENACNNLKDDKYSKCVKNPGTITCMKNRCQKKTI